MRINSDSILLWVNVLLIFVSVGVYKMVNSGMISSSYNVKSMKVKIKNLTKQ